MGNVRIDKACGHTEIVWRDANHPTYTGKEEFGPWLKAEQLKICHEKCRGPKTSSNGRTRKMASGTSVAERDDIEQDQQTSAKPARQKKDPTVLARQKKDYARGYWDAFRGREKTADLDGNAAYAKGFGTGTRNRELKAADSE